MIDRDSDTWREVAEFVQSKRDRGMQTLESPALDFPTTQFVRGQVQALAEVLALPNLQQQLPVLSTEGQSYL